MQCISLEPPCTFICCHKIVSLCHVLNFAYFLVVKQGKTFYLRLLHFRFSPSAFKVAFLFIYVLLEWLLLCFFLWASHVDIRSVFSVRNVFLDAGFFSLQAIPEAFFRAQEGQEKYPLPPPPHRPNPLPTHKRFARLDWKLHLWNNFASSLNINAYTILNDNLTILVCEEIVRQNCDCVECRGWLGLERSLKVRCKFDGTHFIDRKVYDECWSLVVLIVKTTTSNDPMMFSL